jgi:hypothetical protein
LAARRSKVMRNGVAALSVGLLVASPAHAACPMELSVYGDRDKAAEIDFMPRGEAAAVTNRFRMVFGEAMVLDGIVMWSEDVARPNGLLTHKCPEGDVTGEEIAACTVWEGVIYTSDKSGKIGLLPADGSAAPEKLIFPDLAYSLRHSAVFGEAGFSKLPWDVFQLQGCQE